MNQHVTLKQAFELKVLGFDEPCIAYAYRFDAQGKHYIKTDNRNCSVPPKRNDDKHIFILTVPTVDQAIDWIRRKYNIHIINRSEPYVNPTTNQVEYAYRIKQCNTKWGWNQRVYVGHTNWSTNSYAMKRTALWIALRYIKNKNVL